MAMKPWSLIVVMLISGGVAVASPFLAESSASPSDWSGMLEKAGLITFMAFMVRYFQQRNEAMQTRSDTFADRALTCLEKHSENTKDLVDAVGMLKVAIENETVECRELRRLMAAEAKSGGR